MSKYRPTVVLENKLTKDAMRSMGPAKVEVPSPDKYLKKHSKEPKLPESEFSHGLFHYVCVHPRAVIVLFTFMFICSFRAAEFERGS